MENDRRTGDDRRKQVKFADEHDKSFDLLSYKLECAIDSIQKLGNELHGMHRKINE